MTESDLIGGRVQKTLSECIRIQAGCKACRQRSRGAKVNKPHSTFCFGCSDYRHEGGSAAVLSIGIVFSRRYVRDPCLNRLSLITVHHSIAPTRLACRARECASEWGLFGSSPPR